jgi:hypothetical protein
MAKVRLDPQVFYDRLNLESSIIIHKLLFTQKYWTLQIELHVILVFGCIMVLNYKHYLLTLGMFCKLPG